MGTRGHLFVRCRGRWFIYYNQFDSYLEGLGDAIVKRIPTDPEEYHSKSKETISQMIRVSDWNRSKQNGLSQ